MTDTFDFESFYFGCVVMTLEAVCFPFSRLNIYQGTVANIYIQVASVPLSCDVTVTGFKASLEVARETFSFEYDLLTDLLTADVVKAELSDTFKGIDSATFSTEYDISDAVGATLLDNLSYTTYNAKNKVEKNENLE